MGGCVGRWVVGEQTDANHPSFPPPFPFQKRLLSIDVYSARSIGTSVCAVGRHSIILEGKRPPASNPPHQSFHRIRLLHTEIDPCHAAQKYWQIRLLGSVGQ